MYSLSNVIVSLEIGISGIPKQERKVCETKSQWKGLFLSIWQSFMFTVKLWIQVTWKQMEIPFKLCCSIVNFRVAWYYNNTPTGTFELHGQVVSSLLRGPFCCQILKKIFVFLDSFKTNTISLHHKQKTNKNPQTFNTPNPSPTKNSASPHKPHSSSKVWNCNKKLKSWYYPITHLSLCV